MATSEAQRAVELIEVVQSLSRSLAERLHESDPFLISAWEIKTREREPRAEKNEGDEHFADIPVYEVSKDDLAPAIAALTETRLQHHQESVSMLRCPGVLGVDRLVFALVAELNAAKEELAEYMVSTFPEEFQRREIYSCVTPRIATLQLKRQILTLDAPGRLAFSWQASNSVERINANELGEELEARLDVLRRGGETTINEQVALERDIRDLEEVRAADEIVAKYRPRRPAVRVRICPTDGAPYYRVVASPILFCKEDIDPREITVTKPLRDFRLEDGYKPSRKRGREPEIDQTPLVKRLYVHRYAPGHRQYGEVQKKRSEQVAGGIGEQD